MAKLTTVSFDQIKDDLRTLVTQMKTVDGFRIGEPITVQVQAMASHIEAGKTQEAVAAGREAISAGRNILGAFLRNSVIDRRPEGQPERPAYFTEQIRLRRDDEKYDEDIVAGLESKRKKLEEAVRTETNGTYSARVEAYNTLKKALDDADRMQSQRDNVRRQQDAAAKKQKKRQDDVDATERNKAAAAIQRQQMLASRKQEADDIRNLI